MTIRRWGDRSRSSVTGENVGGGADHDSLERDASATIGHTKKKKRGLPGFTRPGLVEFVGVQTTRRSNGTCDRMREGARSGAYVRQ